MQNSSDKILLLNLEDRIMFYPPFVACNTNWTPERFSLDWESFGERGRSRSSLSGPWPRWQPVRSFTKLGNLLWLYQETFLPNSWSNYTKKKKLIKKSKMYWQWSSMRGVDVCLLHVHCDSSPRANRWTREFESKFNLFFSFFHFLLAWCKFVGYSLQSCLVLELVR